MWRYALSSRWWTGHVLVVAFCVVFLGLARWQWDRAHSVGGDWQNFGYALQWPLFAIFLFVAWLRFLWLEQHRGHSPTTPAPAEPVTVPRAPVTSAPAPLPAARGCAPRSTPEDDSDDELAVYNAYLAQLAERDRRR